MLRKSNRLSTKQFLEVMEKGRVYHSPLFLMHVLIPSDDPATGVKFIRIAAVAPKKIAPTAVLRNTIRRRVYEAIQPEIDSMVPGTHAIIFAKAEATRASFKDIVIDLKSLFLKAKISV